MISPSALTALIIHKVLLHPGNYKVSLKVYNSNQNCFAGYSDSVIVGCGVMARFYPDKRIIASKDPKS